jgi:hypothetical protein
MGRRLGGAGLATAAAIALIAGAATAAAAGQAPMVKTVSPNTGPGSGGTEVTLSGNKLSTESCTFFPVGSGCPNVIVYFGSEPGLVVSASKKEIQVFSPEQFNEVGTVNVTVVTPGGSSSKVVTFTYTAPPAEAKPGELPVVSAVEPNHGTRAGFNQVRIKGEHLTPSNGVCVQCNGDVVHFGSANVAVAQGSSTELLVNAPPHATGAVDVTVTTNPGGTSMASPSDLYTYE